MEKQLFQLIKDWQEKTFPQATSLSKLHHLKQEVVELQNAIHTGASDTHLEFADCFMLLFGAAASYGMTYQDIQACILDKYDINLNRKWG